jgi:YidC/Oxa1 family membrane protein insertase
MERRVLIVLVLSFLVFYVYQTYVVKPVQKQTQTAVQTAQKNTAAFQPGGIAEATSTAATSKAPAAATPPPPSAAVQALVGDTSERDIRLETQDVIAVFTNRGARLKSWRLKKYFDQQGQPQELIEQQLASHPLPFTLISSDEHLDATLNGALYAVAEDPSSPVTAPATLRFEYRDSAGIHAVKEFELAPTSYVVTVRSTVMSGARPIDPAISWGPAVGDIAEISRYTQAAEGLLFERGGKIQRIAAKDVSKQPTHEGDFLYGGVDDNYFMTVALSPGSSRIAFQTVTIPAPAGSKDPGRQLVSYSVEPKNAEAGVKFFAGPKDFGVLTAIDPRVAEAINFGYFRVIVVPLLNSLKGINKYVANYGWAIVILTVILNVIIFPLRHKSVVSMRKMQEIQPEVKAIQDRYAKLKATDPAKQKMNQELMGLYKARGVNPASGCVPILLTFPLIFAFYALLSTAIELRGAPFILWIHDLSAHDPYYVTPVLMGASQLWQQWMMPATGVDPAQQKMMMFMPIMFTFMFLWAPAGLAVYWLVSNVWQIGQQYVTNYMIGPPSVRTVRPAAERRVKRVGGGKTEAADAKNHT